MIKRTRSGETVGRHCWLYLLLGGLLVSLVLPSMTGCTRRFFRRAADKEANAVIAEKDVYPQWKIENFYVRPDPRARFANPYNLDRPPMPPDDPAAKTLTPNSQKPYHISGIARVEGQGYLDLLGAWDVENRLRRQLREKKSGDDVGDEDDAAEAAADKYEGLKQTQFEETPSKLKPFLINMEQAVLLGLINSREFQNRREDLYLAALPVTLQRFSFASQFFFTEEAIRERTGSLSASGKNNRWTFDTGTGFTKLFSTGALLVLRLANETVVNLTGDFPRHTVSVSDINLDLAQPLLRGGGRAVTLEALTQAERDLVYEIRSYARFRKLFYVSLVAGGESLPGGGVGGIGGGVAVAAISGVQTPEVRPGAAGRLILATGQAAQPQGYLQTLLLKAQLENEKQNVARLAEVLTRFRAFAEGGVVEKLQVDQVESDLLRSQNRVLQQQKNLRDSYDRFKIQLGLPVNEALELEDEPIRPVNEHFTRYENTFEDFEAVIKAAQESRDIDNPKKLRGQLKELLENHPAVRGTQFQKNFPARWKEWIDLDDDAIKKRLQKIKLDRQELLLKRDILEKKNQTLTAQEIEQLAQLQRQYDIGQFELVLRVFEQEPWKNEPNKIVREGKFADAFLTVLGAFTNVINEARDERLSNLRNVWPELPPVIVNGRDLLASDLDEAEGVAATTAIENRLDLMNARAQVVDAWRQINIFANSLMGVFNVRYHLDSSTPSGEAKPLAFSGSRARHQLIFNMELPLVRKSERNAYRASLIGFERARRALMAVEDNIVNTVREEIRQLRVLAKNYKIQQQAVHIAYPQVDSAEETFFGARDPQQAQRLTSATSAALTNQLLNAQSNLVQSQNTMYGVWINYLQVRLQLYRDLELMQIDPRGVWLDEYATNESYSGPDGCFPADEWGPAEELPPPAPAGGPELLPPPTSVPGADVERPE